MIHASLEIILYGLAASASVLILSATVVIVRSDRPRTNAIAFLIGFVAGTVLACVVGLVVGQAAVDRLDSHETLKAVLTVLLGAALVVVGLRSRHPAPGPVERSSRAAAIMAGLKDMGPAASASMAGLLGFGGPKRLLLTVLAMATATQADLRGIADLTLVALYLVLATLTVSVPVAFTLVAGQRASVPFARIETWLAEHSGSLRTWLSLGIGALLLVDGLAKLIW